MADKKLTEIAAGSAFGNNAVIHVADPDNPSQGPDGSSFKFLFRNLTQKAAFDALVAQVSELADAQNNILRRFNYGFVLDTEENEGLDITSADAAAYINSLATAIVITRIQTPVIFEFQKSVVGGTQRYVFIFSRGEGTWGTTGGGATVFPGDFYRLPVVKLVLEDIEDDANTVTNDLGEIAPEDFLTEANSEVRLLENPDYIYYFVYTSDGVEYSMRFVGTNGIYGGGGTALVEDDFVAGPTSETTPGVVPTLNDVTQQGNQSQVPLIVANDNDDLGKTVYGADRMTYSNTFFDREYFLNPEAGGMNTIARMADVILRTGTNEGYPIRGTFDIDGTDSTPFFLRKVVAGVGTMYLAIADGIVNLSCFLGTGQGVQFDITPDGISFQSTKPGSKGLSSAQDFSGVVTELDYVQKKYVDRHGNLKNSTVDSSPLTGTTTESVMATCTVPANYLSAGRLSIEMPFTKGGSNDILSVKLYRNSTPDLSGSPTLLGAFNTTATTRFVPFKRDFWLKAAGTLWGYNATNSANVDGLSATSLVPQTTSFAFNTTFYLVVTAQLANSGDNAVNNGFRVKFEKSI